MGKLLEKLKGIFSGIFEKVKEMKFFEKITQSKAFEKAKSIFQSLVRRKVLLFSLIVVVALLIATPVLFNTLKQKQNEVEIATGEMTLGNVRFVIPDGAFPYQKKLRIKTVPRNTLDQSLLTNVVSEVYEVIPSDGLYDMAITPMRVKFYFLSSLIGSDSANNLSIAVISKSSKTVSILPGCNISRDSYGYYVEASLLSVPEMVTLVALPGKREKIGVQEVYRTISAKPSLLIVPGSDPNFAGYFESPSTSPLTTWQNIFPDRSIYVFLYPLTEPRSYNYTRAMQKFVENDPNQSVIAFEAERLKDFLLQNSDRQFDILAHEIGGLITYYTLAKYPQIKNVRKVVYLSTPFYGTNAADPRSVSVVYNKDALAISQVYALSSTTVSRMQSFLKSYIDSINIYYHEIVPNSSFLSDLKFLPYRLDLDTVAFCGKTPPLSIDVTGSYFEKLFPELALNVGDGIVTRSTARLPYMKLYIVNGSAFDYYNSQDFIEEIKKILDYKIPQVPAYTDDKFREAASATERALERFIETAKRLTFTTGTWTLGRNPYLTFIQTLPYPGYEIATHGSLIYTSDRSALYVGGTKLFDGNVRDLKESIDGISYRIENKVIYRRFSELSTFDYLDSDDFLATRDYAIFARPRPNNRIQFVDSYGNTIVELRGVYGKIIYTNNEIILLTNMELYRYFYGIRYKVPTGPGILFDLTYATVIDDYIYATTRNLGLLVFDREGNYAYVGEGWIGNKSLHYVNELLIAVGDGFITVIDPKNRRIDGIVQDLDAIVYDTALIGNKVLLLTSKGLLLYQIKTE